MNNETNCVEDFNRWNSYNCPVCGRDWAEEADTEDKTSACDCGRSEETEPYASELLDTKPVITNLFWDCNCKKDNIRYAHENGCGICLAIADEMPNSHISEVDSTDLIGAEQFLQDELKKVQVELERRRAEALEAHQLYRAENRHDF